MGQAITVVEKSTTTPGVVRFELNRSLSGMGHQTYRPGHEFTSSRPADQVAQLLLGRPGVETVHVFSNEITVRLASDAKTAGLLEAIEGLFIHYREGVTPSLP